MTTPCFNRFEAMHHPRAGLAGRPRARQDDLQALFEACK
jgi:hypothetical protein